MALLLLMLFIYLGLPFMQLISARRIMATLPEFPKSDRPVTVVVGVRSSSPALERALRSICEQIYPAYEVLFVSEREEDPGAMLARSLARTYEHVRFLISGPHDPLQCTAKNHNHLYGARHARNDILLFGDADIVYPPEWIMKMVSPLGKKLDGRIIEGVSAPFVFVGRTPLTRFFVLSSNVAMFLSSFSSRRQAFPPYSAGASIAVEKDLFFEIIAPYWEKTFNDDLVFAYVMTSKGKTVFLQRALILRAEEDLSSLRKLWEKMIRWTVTVHRFQHPKMRREIGKTLILNAQAPLCLALSLVFLIMGWFSLSAILIPIAVLHTIVFRHLIARLLGEELGAMVLLTPLSYAIWGSFYLFGSPFLRRFRWAGHVYLAPRKFRL